MAKLKIGRLLHKKSLQVEGSNQPKLPTPEQIEYGEIAVNYGDGVETLSIKNSSNNITTFSSDAIIDAKVEKAKASATTKLEVEDGTQQIALNESTNEDGSKTYKIGFVWGEFK